MSKILLIISREYLTRVRKRSFIVMTILGPLLMAALMIVPVYIAKQSDKQQSVSVIDDSGLFYGKLKTTKDVDFTWSDMDIGTAKKEIEDGNIDMVLYIPKTELTVPEKAIIYSHKQPSLTVTSYVENQIKKEVEQHKLLASGIDENVLRSIKTKINLTTIRIDEEGSEKKTSSAVSTAIGIFSGIMIYFFIFLFGSQVMRGVIEEKTSRIVEVIISSVKPFQLMMGKIVGVGLVGLTQFLLWVVLTFVIITVFQLGYSDNFGMESAQEMVQSQNPIGSPAADMEEGLSGAGKVFEILESINFPVMILTFLFFFLGGYLLYSALFAAIGSAVDNEADTQQFMMPVTIPLIFAIVMAQYVANNPEGPVAFWLSMIPLTSPVIMMMRIPFGVPYWELALSMGLLIAGFLGTTWLAAKIYRTGILMYGKKTSYRELWKWLTYR